MLCPVSTADEYQGPFDGEGGNPHVTFTSQGVMYHIYSITGTIDSNTNRDFPNLPVKLSIDSYGNPLLVNTYG